jgi:hypothetical protein
MNKYKVIIKKQDNEDLSLKSIFIFVGILLSIVIGHIILLTSFNN